MEFFERIGTALTACFVLSLSQTLSGSPIPQSSRYTLSVDVNLVVLHVTVQDKKGIPVPGLGKDNFHVYDNGVSQKIRLFRREDVPATVGLVLDNSGSMRRKRTEVTAAALVFARSSNPEDEMFVVNFNEHVSMGLPPNKAFTSSVNELQGALSRFRADGKTALYDATAVALEHLQESPLKKKALIIVSDGGDNASARNFRQTLRMAEHSDAIIYTVGVFDEYDEDRNPGVLKRIAKVTGGRAFFPDDIKAVTGVLRRISEEIRNQYTIGYVPETQKRDGAYHSVRVTLSGHHSHNWLVRTRTGYFAPSQEQSRNKIQTP
jgi:Ca-activated chloride channel family protein